MDREAMEARLAHLQQQYQQAEARRNVVAQELDRLNRALVMLEGGIAEIQFLLQQEEAEESAQEEETTGLTLAEGGVEAEKPDEIEAKPGESLT